MSNNMKVTPNWTWIHLLFCLHFFCFCFWNGAEKSCQETKIINLKMIQTGGNTTWRISYPLKCIIVCLICVEKSFFTWATGAILNQQQHFEICKNIIASIWSKVLYNETGHLIGQTRIPCATFSFCKVHFN